MASIKVLPGDSQIQVEDGANLRDALTQAGFLIKSTCGGCATCALCVVVVPSGEENLSEITFEEKQLLGNVFHITNERLSCQTNVLGDVTVDISAHLEKKKPVVTKRRTKEEKEKIIQDRKDNRKERPAKLGGGKRPKAFSTKE